MRIILKRIKFIKIENQLALKRSKIKIKLNKLAITRLNLD